MAQGRFLSTSIATDPRLNSLSLEAHLVYLHMIPHLDRDGCITGNPLELWAIVCPLLDVRNRMPDLVQELCSTGLAQVTDDGNGLWLSGFPKNQRITPSRYAKEAASKYTIPAQVQHKGNPSVTPVSPTGSPTPLEGKGEVKGKGEGEVTPPAQAQPTYRNAEQRRALGNIEAAAKVGMTPAQLRELTDWLLEQTGQACIVDAEPVDSGKLGKAQLSAITLWGLGFDNPSGWQDLQDWLDASKYQPPYYLGNYEQAAAAIVKGTKPPTGKKEMAVNRTMANAAALMQEYIANEAKQ